MNIRKIQAGSGYGSETNRKEGSESEKNDSGSPTLISAPPTATKTMLSQI
jgi:hypothetical protein